jgi:hypothetical protein
MGELADDLLEAEMGGFVQENGIPDYEGYILSLANQPLPPESKGEQSNG